MNHPLTGEPLRNGEDYTRPRWICPITGNVEHCRDDDRSPQAAKRRLKQLCSCKTSKKHEYRAGFIPKMQR